MRKRCATPSTTINQAQRQRGRGRPISSCGVSVDGQGCGQCNVCDGSSTSQGVHYTAANCANIAGMEAFNYQCWDLEIVKDVRDLVFKCPKSSENPLNYQVQESVEPVPPIVATTTTTTPPPPPIEEPCDSSSSKSSKSKCSKSKSSKSKSSKSKSSKNKSSKKGKSSKRL